ncbi:MAG: carboxymuconolactone decarboxylase family protein [Rhizorhabdus sp.]
MTVPVPASDGPYVVKGIHNIPFREMWNQPGLDMRARSFITLACVGAADTAFPIQTHVDAAMQSGDITYDEIREFVLHFAVYLGWPKASIVEQVVEESWARIQEEGGPVTLERPQVPGA